MRKIVFDIETQNWFQEVGSNNPADLDLALIAIHDSETDQYDSFLEEELTTLWPIIESADVLIGFNSDHFDIPLLDTYYPGDLTSIRSIDLMKEVQKVLGRRLSLDNIAEATLSKGKTAHGSEAVNWWKEGKIEEIRKYCIADVELTKDLYEYARDQGHLKYSDRDFGNSIRTLELNTEDWEDGGSHSMTHSLGF